MINSVGYVDYFNAPYANTGARQVSSQHAAVFGSGLNSSILSKKDNSAVAAATGVVGTVTALALAIMFRGKIKGGISKLVKAVKPYVPQCVKNVVKQGLNFIKPATDAVVKVLRKGFKIVDPYLNGIKKFVSKHIIKPIAKLLGKGSTVAATAPATPTP